MSYSRQDTPARNLCSAGQRVPGVNEVIFVKVRFAQAVECAHHEDGIKGSLRMLQDVKALLKRRLRFRVTSGRAYIDPRLTSTTLKAGCAPPTRTSASCSERR